MAYGIMICESNGIYYSHLFADDTFYKGMKASLSNSFIAGKKGISDEKIDNIREKVNGLVAKLNCGEPVDIEKEFIMISAS